MPEAYSSTDKKASAACSGEKLEVPNNPEAATALRQIAPRLLMKFEMDQAGGSHKARAARRVVRLGIARGLIIPGVSKVIEKTGGNFGLGLALACQEVGVPLELAMGLSFSPVRREHLRWLGVNLIGEDEMRRGKTPREVLEKRLSQAGASGRSYHYPDQFNNHDCVDAHELSTGAELVAQLADRPEVQRVHLVACAGTGAHLTGISRALRQAGYPLVVTLVEPEGCRTQEGVFVDHPLEGMSVGVKPPLLDWSLVHETVSVSPSDARDAQAWLARERGYWVGRTASACLAVGLRLAQRLPPGTSGVLIAYDHGGWYSP